MASCNPLHETQQFEAMRDALRRAVTGNEEPTRRERRDHRPIKVFRRRSR